VYQQLSGKAAATIEGRFKGIYNDEFPTPQQLLKTGDDVLRGVGLSRNKLLSMQDLARHCDEGKLDFDKLHDADDEFVIEHLIQVRGIGRWTAQMFLMFTLGCLDVFPTADLGIQKAIQLLYGYKKLPAERTMNKHANPWKPHRTLACWYLWTLVD
jgi:3-methyladenine DNA glycosylase/8-oxoguanine DNA glycosylase